MSQVIVQLGRFGDILSLLPLLYENCRNGRRQRLMLAKQFEGLLDGVSYVDKIVFDGDCSRIDQAEPLARRADRNAKVAQVFGRGLNVKRTGNNFQRDGWTKLGGDRRWEQCELIIDRRDVKRELELACRFDWSLPVVLVNASGISSPFPGRETLCEDLQVRLAGEFNVADISSLKATRIYDVLGLLDRAHCLVSTDSAYLHLAPASSVLVAALVNDTQWLASARRANHIYHKKYSQYDAEQLAAVIRKSRRTTPDGKKPGGTLIHVYAEWNMSADDRQRWSFARKSWMLEYATDNWLERPVNCETEPGQRNSKTLLKDPRAVNYVRDMVETGFRSGSSGEDIVVLTNSDISFSPGIAEKIRRIVDAKGCLYGYRWDYDGNPDEPLTYHETVSCRQFGGLDIFAFRRDWWEKNGHHFPDMCLGRSHWDLVWRDCVKWLGGGCGYGLISHKTHASFWQQDRNKMPGNAYNLGKAHEFWKHVDSSRPFKNLT